MASSKNKRAEVQAFFRTLGPLPCSALASAEAPRQQKASDRSLKVARQLVGGFLSQAPDAGAAQVKRLASKLDRLQSLARQVDQDRKHG
jgi:hypothetical protein